jgi:hypothetical protein
MLILNHGGRQGYVLAALQGAASTPQGPHSLRSRVIMPSSSKR